MSSTSTDTARPQRLLLATDLSARCDRALDRAALLASEWQAELAVLNVLDMASAPDCMLAWIGGATDDELQAIVLRQLRQDLSDLEVPTSMHINKGTDPVASIRSLAQQLDAGLVVTGVARDEILGRFLLGSTVSRLARSLPQPLLVVRKRARKPYRNILVATDFSVPSRHALLTALHLFPGRTPVLCHILEPPSPILANPASPAALLQAEQQCAAFVAECGLPPDVSLPTVVESGTVESRLSAYVRQHNIELVVMGSQGRSGLSGVLLGSVATRLLDWLPCDALLVRHKPIDTE